MNYLAGRHIDECNKMAGARLAHVDGGVPNLHIEIPCSTYYLGALLYFFEKSLRHQRVPSWCQSV